MQQPPKDRNFLALVDTVGFVNGQWINTGTKWVECYWTDDLFYGEPCFAEWCGHKDIKTTAGQINIIKWTELPN